MTDEQIIKELEKSACYEDCTTECPFYYEKLDDEECGVLMLNRALALIGRQREEIERLTVERDEARRDCAVAERNHAYAETVCVERARSDAMQAFAEQLIYGYSSGFDGDTICVQDVRELLREMTEEQK